MRHNIESGNGNVTAQDATKLLNANTDSIVMNNLQTDTLDVSLACRYDFELRTPVQSDHDYSDVPNFGSLSNYKMSVVTYMAGYVVKMVRLKIHCPECLTALTNDIPSDTLGSRFVNLKNRGLVQASISVVLVCETTEKCFNRIEASTKGRLPRASKLVQEIALVVLAEVGKKCF